MELIQKEQEQKPPSAKAVLFRSSIFLLIPFFLLNIQSLQYIIQLCQINVSRGTDGISTNLATWITDIKFKNLK
jgi:hypothetical protein